MSSKELYKRFTNLCQKWPKDESKAGRDYAEYFRDQISKYFPHGEHGQVTDIKAAESAIGPLERIANNSYYKENALKRSSASGAEAWVCNQSISNEGIKQLQDDDESSIVERLKSRLSVRFSRSKLDHKVSEEFGTPKEKKDNKN